MKLLTLAVAIALLGTLFFGCDESKTMMEEVTRETGETGETPTAGEVFVSETDCEGAYRCFPGFSYTNVPGDDNTGQLTIYVDIPEALGDGPHAVTVTYDPTWLETDIPNKRLLEEDDWKQIESTFFLKRGDTIVFEYQFQYIDGKLYGANIGIWEDFHLRDPNHKANQEPLEWADSWGTPAGTIGLEPERK